MALEFTDDNFDDIITDLSGKIGATKFNLENLKGQLSLF